MKKNIKTTRTSKSTLNDFCAMKNGQRMSLSDYWILYLIPIFIWMVIIYLLSSQSMLTTGSSSFDLSMYVMRKTAHVCEYLVLTILIARAVRVLGQSINHVLFISGSIAFVYAISDEWHQSFIPLREGKLTDIGIDLIGIVLALLILAFWYRRSKVNSNDKKCFS